MNLWLLRRLLGLACIVDGFAALLSPFNPGLALKVARLMARVRFDRERRND